VEAIRMIHLPQPPLRPATRTGRPVCLFIATLLSLAVAASSLRAAGVEFLGHAGPGKGKRIVLVAGDDEYHSEEMLPQLAKILAERQGFDCTVLFAINPTDGTIDPHQRRNIPGLEALEKADLLILFVRFRDLPDDQMKNVVDYLDSGRPVIGIRTATHAFAIEAGQTYARYSWNSKIEGWDGGFGRKVLGETWVAHHGDHGKQSTRAVIVPGEDKNPILRGIGDREIWVPTDVYAVRLPLPATCQPLLLGLVLSGIEASAPSVPGKPNDPMLPVAWTNAYTGTLGKTSRVFTTTMGSADDFLNDAFRRLLVNASFWALGLEAKIPAKADVGIIGTYQPRSFLDEDYTKGVHPPDLAK
jgi:hypothetical protein